MKRILLLFTMCLLAFSFAWAAPGQPALTYVKATHPRPNRHHAHKAARHRAPKRRHNRHSA